jgi:hypothetical protein
MFLRWFWRLLGSESWTKLQAGEPFNCLKPYRWRFLMDIVKYCNILESEPIMEVLMGQHREI